MKVQPDGWVKYAEERRVKGTEAPVAMLRHRNRQFPSQSEMAQNVAIEDQKRAQYMAQKVPQMADQKENLELAALITRVALNLE
jgi:hypothetical protein